MLKEQLDGRHVRMERELSQLCYRRLLLTRELETIDKRIAQLEGAIQENEAASRDAATEAAITAARETGNNKEATNG